MQKSSDLLTRWATVILLCICFTGCSTITNIKKSNEEKKIAAEQKKQLFLTLKSDIRNKILRKGTAAETIKKKYGEPDNIFLSSSSESSFQVWTYFSNKDKLAESQVDSVILYIETDKLASWKY